MLAVCVGLATASAAAAATAPGPRYGDPGHPDLSGVWQPTTPLTARNREPVPLTPAYAAKLAATRKLVDDGHPPQDSVSLCIAFGMPRYMTLAFEIVQTPGQLVMVNSVLTDVRRIYIGRGHTPDVEPSFSGDSIGHWEGDTLVVETNALLAGTMDQYGVPYSDKLTIVERFRRVDATTLEDVITMTDPDALTRPFVWSRQFRLQPGDARLEEYHCVNNRNLGANGLQDAR